MWTSSTYKTDAPKANLVLKKDLRILKFKMLITGDAAAAGRAARARTSLLV